MAFGPTSAIFQQAMVNPIVLGPGANTGFPTSYGSTGLLGDTVNVALYGNSGTPDKTAAVANTGYNTGQWTTGNEVSGAGYSAGGTALTSKTYGLDTGSSSMIFKAANPSWTSATITAYGDLVYDNTITAGTVAKQGMCFHSFGGSAQTVSGGTFTILWATPGGAGSTAVFNITV
jgi:hypothetical protein